MLKVGSKRRRSTAQLAELKEEELRKKERTEQLEKQNRELQQKLELQQAQSQDAFEAKDILSRLYE